MSQADNLEKKFMEQMDDLWNNYLEFCKQAGAGHVDRETFAMHVFSKVMEHVDDPATMAQAAEKIARETYERHAPEDRKGGVFVGARVVPGESAAVSSAIEECERCHQDMWVSLSMTDAYRDASKHLCMTCVASLTGKSEEQLIAEALGHGKA